MQDRAVRLLIIYRNAGFWSYLGSIPNRKILKDGEKPLSNAMVNGLVDEKGKAIKNLEVTIPNWLQPVHICRHFNGKPIVFLE